MNLGIKQLVVRGQATVNRVREAVEAGQMSFVEAEEEILRYTNEVGALMVQEVLDGVKEPVVENRIVVGGKVAVYDGKRNLRFINRFGKETVRERRCYKYLEQPGGYYPLDRKLRMEVCGGFSPYMTYLIALHAVTDSYEESAKLLSETLGFRVSSTAVQRNTEQTGAQIPECPYELIPGGKTAEECDVMVVEIDGTMTPQISEKAGVSGRESLKLPTEYKECNVVVIDKYRGGEQTDHWVGAKYGPRSIFEEYVRKTALQMGQIVAKTVLFIADGAHTNWEIRKTNFPEAQEILDFYHAFEHIGAFCQLYRDKATGGRQKDRWTTMMFEGDVLQMIEEIKTAIPTLTDPGKGMTELGYFRNNKDRMHYDEYRRAGYPIGSGVVEGACKNVVGKRFKGSGMRWKKADNDYVLRTRLSELNDMLVGFFRPHPVDVTIVAQQAAA
jgi:Uncharacterised protein family (UPF0236)